MPVAFDPNMPREQRLEAALGWLRFFMHHPASFNSEHSKRLAFASLLELEQLGARMALGEVRTRTQNIVVYLDPDAPHYAPMAELTQAYLREHNPETSTMGQIQCHFCGSQTAGQHGPTCPFNLANQMGVEPLAVPEEDVLQLPRLQDRPTPRYTQPEWAALARVIFPTSVPDHMSPEDVEAWQTGYTSAITCAMAENSLPLKTRTGKSPWGQGWDLARLHLASAAGPMLLSQCTSCGAAYPSAPTGHLHKCGACPGTCERIFPDGDPYRLPVEEEPNPCAEQLFTPTNIQHAPYPDISEEELTEALEMAKHPIDREAGRTFDGHTIRTPKNTLNAGKGTRATDTRTKAPTIERTDTILGGIGLQYLLAGQALGFSTEHTLPAKHPRGANATSFKPHKGTDHLLNHPNPTPRCKVTRAGLFNDFVEVLSHFGAKVPPPHTFQLFKSGDSVSSEPSSESAPDMPVEAFEVSPESFAGSSERSSPFATRLGEPLGTPPSPPIEPSRDTEDTTSATSFNDPKSFSDESLKDPTRPASEILPHKMRWEIAPAVKCTKTIEQLAPALILVDLQDQAQRVLATYTPNPGSIRGQVRSGALRTPSSGLPYMELRPALALRLAGLLALRQLELPFRQPLRISDWTTPATLRTLDDRDWTSLARWARQ